MIESELKLREKDYQQFLKGFRASTLSISQSSDIVDPESSLTKGLPRANSLSQASDTAHPKMVKFVDENTLERFQRHQDIGNGINISDSGSKSSESDFTNSLQDSVKEVPTPNGGNKPDAVKAKNGRYHYMGPESIVNVFHHQTSAPIVGLGMYVHVHVTTTKRPLPFLIALVLLM